MICSSLILFICQLYHHFEISQQLLSAAGIFKELQPPHSSPPYNPSSVSWSEVSERLSESLSCPGGWRQMVLVSIMYSDDENRITQEPTKGGQIDVNTQLPFCSRSVIQLIVCKCLLNVSFWGILYLHTFLYRDDENYFTLHPSLTWFTTHRDQTILSNLIEDTVHTVWISLECNGSILIIYYLKWTIIETSININYLPLSSHTLLPPLLL